MKDYATLSYSESPFEVGLLPTLISKRSQVLWINFDLAYLEHSSPSRTLHQLFPLFSMPWYGKITPQSRQVCRRKQNSQRTTRVWDLGVAGFTHFLWFRIQWLGVEQWYTHICKPLQIKPSAKNGLLKTIDLMFWVGFWGLFEICSSSKSSWFASTTA